MNFFTFKMKEIKQINKHIKITKFKCIHSHVHYLKYKDHLQMKGLQKSCTNKQKTQKTPVNGLHSRTTRHTDQCSTAHLKT